MQNQTLAPLSCKCTPSKKTEVVVKARGDVTMEAGVSWLEARRRNFSRTKNLELDQVEALGRILQCVRPPQ